jgi:hypothetical protein
MEGCPNPSEGEGMSVGIRIKMKGVTPDQFNAMERSVDPD